jgi:Domain of unknown function (DUF5668)
MRLHRGFLGWGVFFLVAGVIALAVEAGSIPDQRWWSYWPLLLVGAGIGLVLYRTPLDVLGGLLVAGTFGVMVGGSLAGGFSGIGDLSGGVCSSDGDGVTFADRSGDFGSSATVSIELDCGTLGIATTPGSGWAVRGADGDGRGPDVASSDDELEVDPSDDRWSPTAWLIALPTDPRLEVGLQLNAGQLRAEFPDANLDILDLEVNAGQAIVDLTGVTAIDGIDVGVNAGELALTLPSVAMTGSIEVNAGNVRICAPPDVALRLETDSSVLASTDFSDAGLVRRDDAWESPGYDTATTRIEMRVQANLGNVDLDPAEGCS